MSARITETSRWNTTQQPLFTFVTGLLVKNSALCGSRFACASSPRCTVGSSSHLFLDVRSEGETTKEEEGREGKERKREEEERPFNAKFTDTSRILVSTVIGQTYFYL